MIQATRYKGQTEQAEAANQSQCIGFRHSRVGDAINRSLETRKPIGRNERGKLEVSVRPSVDVGQSRACQRQVIYACERLAAGTFKSSFHLYIGQAAPRSVIAR